MEKIKKLFISVILLALVSPSFVLAESEIPQDVVKPEVTQALPVGPESLEESEPAPAVQTVEPNFIPEEVEQKLPIAPEDQPAVESVVTETKSEENPVEDNKNGEPEEKTEAEVTNDGKVVNNVSAEAVTGENEANYNTSDAKIETGEANNILSVLNLLNTNFITGSDGKILFLYKNYFQDLIGNYLIDPESGESYDLNGSRILNNLILNNQANLNNNYNLVANTGGNSASYNTGNGEIKTGDANISLNVLNFLNSNFLASESGLVAVVNVFGNWIGNLIVPGNFLPAQTETSSTSKLGVSNNAQVANNVSADLNTGGNEASYNTGSGNISTGSAIANVAVSNILNQNIIGDVIYFTFVNVLGNWNGQDLVSNQIANTGTSELDSNNSIINNTLIQNTFHLLVNTGENIASFNTGSGNITTGDARAAVNLMNFANLNVSGKKIVILVVNVFGDWTGNIQKEEVPGQRTVAEPGSQNVIPVSVQIFKAPLKNVKNLFGNKSNINPSPEPEVQEGVLAAEDFNFDISDFPNLLNSEDLEPQVAAISDVIDFSYRYLFVSALITLIIFGIVYTRIRKGIM